jgi:hypothetical protein
LITLPGQVAVINLGTWYGDHGPGTPGCVQPGSRPAPRSACGPGDVAGAYTRIDRAVRLLGWRQQYDIADGIRHSVQ